MLGTQIYSWSIDGEVIATLEVRHQKFEMLLNVVAEVSGKVRVKMAELNRLGMYPNDETPTGRLFAQFIISGGYNWNSRWRDFKTILDQVLGLYGTEVTALRIIGVSYSNGFGTSCPSCNCTIVVRDQETARIFDRVVCPECGEVFEIVVPEDPSRELTQDDLESNTTAHWRGVALSYYKDHPEVIPSPVGLRH